MESGSLTTVKDRWIQHDTSLWVVACKGKAPIGRLHKPPSVINSQGSQRSLGVFSFLEPPMTELPIIFSSQMVLAIMDGRKTQTRRLRGLDTINENPGYWTYNGAAVIDRKYVHLFINGLHSVMIPVRVAPGDRLWVREAWAACHLRRNPDGEYVSVADDFAVRAKCDLREQHLVYRADGGDAFEGKWRHSINMPRWAARLFLDVTAEERCERLQDISEGDAKAEGARPCTTCGGTGAVEIDGVDAGCTECLQRPYSRWFEMLWDSIHGPGAWALNPWVRVITFKRSEMN